MQLIRIKKTIAYLAALLVLCLFSQASLAEESLSLTTSYVGAESNNPGNMFDVTVTGNQNLVIDNFDVNIYQSSGTPTINVYYRAGSYAAGSSSPDGWIYVGSSTVTAAPVDTPTAINVGNIRLNSGQTYGFYITTTEVTDRLHYISEYSTTGISDYSDDNMTISPGAGKALPEFTGSTYEPRVWSGTIYYHIYEPAAQSKSTRQHEAQHAFWTQVNGLIRSAEDGGVVEIDLTTINQMPRYVMRLLAENPNVTLVLTYNSKSVTIPGSLALAKDSRSAFTFEELMEFYSEAQ